MKIESDFFAQISCHFVFSLVLLGPHFHMVREETTAHSSKKGERCLPLNSSSYHIRVTLYLLEPTFD